MPNKLKYLSICTFGHSRSVCLSRVLHERKQEALDCGWATAPSGLIHLCDWADRILVICRHALDRIPFNHRDKIIDFTSVGPDRWVNPYNKELHALLARMVQERLSLSLCQCGEPLYWTSPLRWHHASGVKCDNIGIA